MTHDQEAEPSSRYDEQEPGIQTKVEHGNGASSMIGHFSHSYRKKTLNELDEGFRAIRGPWNKSDECKALVTQIRRLAATRKQQPLFQNIVALGIGSFHLSHQKEIPRRSGFQLAAILTIRDTMSGKLKSQVHILHPVYRPILITLLEESDKPMTCTVQDPAYSELEKDYLRSLDLEVVDDPDAYSRIDATSLVFHLGGYFDFAWWIAEGVWPAVMITSDWGNPRPALVRHNPAYFVTFVHYMFRHYDCEPLAGDCDGDGSADGDVIREGSTNIYRRKHSTFALSLDQHILDTAA